MPNNSINIDTDNFETEVLTASAKLPVLVDFWADWCQPCKNLMPVLEKLATEYSGKLILAKVNTEEQQELAMQYGVRSLPTVKLFRHAKVIAEFSGALPEAQVRQFLQSHIPSATDEALLQVNELISNGQYDQAQQQLESLQQLDADNDKIRLCYIELLLTMGQTQDAQNLWNQLPIAQQESAQGKRIHAKLDINLDAELTTETLAELHQQLAAQPKDAQLRYKLGLKQIQDQDFAAGIETLLILLQHNANYADGAAKTAILNSFQLIDDATLLQKYRRKLSSLLL